MKYCFTYQKFNTNFMKLADEILITYNREDTTLPDFLELYKDKTIVIKINIMLEESDLELLSELNIKYHNIKLQLFVFDKDLIYNIKEKNIPFFTTLFVSNWDAFRGLIDLGVSDIYVVENLAFELDKCGKIAHENGVQIRVFPNICQTAWVDIPDIKKFFIRPDDVEYYEPYVDVFEFMCDVDKEEPLYKIYKDRKWFGELSEIITDFNAPFDGRCVLPLFGKMRVSCGKRCMSGSSCGICDSIQELSKSLGDKDLYISKGNNKED